MLFSLGFSSGRRPSGGHNNLRGRRDVCYWHLADIGVVRAHVRFRSKADIYAKILRGNDNRLWRLARDHSFRPGPARNRRRRKDREISVAALELIEADLVVSYGRKLTA